MSVAIATGLGVGMAALAMDAVWLSPPPLEIGTVEGARILLGSVTGGVITVAVFGLWVRTVVVGIMSANFSPRTLLIFLYDRFQRNLLACMSAGAASTMSLAGTLSTLCNCAQNGCESQQPATRKRPGI